MAAAILLLGGCVTPGQQAKTRQDLLGQMQEDIQRLKRDINDLRANGAVDIGSGPELADLSNRVNQFERDIQSITGGLEELDYALKSTTQPVATPADKVLQGKLAKVERKQGELDEKLELLALRIDSISTTLPATTQTVPPVTPTLTPSGDTTKLPSPKELYDEAYELYRKGEYVRSMERFRAYIKAYPDTALTDNAHFWIGESYYDQEQFEQAILQYDKVVQTFPDGDKVSSAILKQAFAFSAIGDNLDAKILLRKVIKDHPDSEQATIAKKKLEVLGE